MIEIAILKNFDSGTYKAGVQLAGSLTTYFDDISVAKNIPSSALVIGNYAILAIPGGNPKDACVIATWPQGSPGGDAGSFLDLSDTPSSYSGQARKILRVDSAENAIEFDVKADSIAVLNKSWWYENFASQDAWTPYTGGSGSYARALFDLILKTGAANGSYSGFWASAAFNHPHWLATWHYARIRVQSDPVNSIFRVYWVKRTESIPPSDVANMGGFKIVNGRIWTINANGTTATQTDTGIDLANGSFADLELLGTGTAIQFYVNNNLVATHTTNLPAPWYYGCYIEAKNTIAADKQLRVIRAAYKD
jgi:hypothetical protein